MRHRFHSMCPYFAMFPEQFAEKWIANCSAPGDVVLDPFAGRGTAPFQALLMGRQAVASDINPVAACLNMAKLAPPTKASVRRRLSELQREYLRIGAERGVEENSTEFFEYAFHPETLAEIRFMRKQLGWRTRRTDSVLSALLLGSLHGEVKSKRYLSNQMPRTISTKPNYSVKFWKSRDLQAPRRKTFEVLREAIEYRYASPRPAEKGNVHFGDMRDLPRVWSGELASLVVTSPPYGALTSYEEDQWLRLWALGGPSTPGKSRITRDDQLQKAGDYWAFIGDFWRAIGLVTAKDAVVVVRVGAIKSSPDVLAKQFAASIALGPREGELVSVAQSPIAGRQTRAFTPGTKGCGFEVDLQFVLR